MKRETPETALAVRWVRLSVATNEGETKLIVGQSGIVNLTVADEGICAKRAGSAMRIYPWGVVAEAHCEPTIIGPKRARRKKKATK